MERVSNKSPGSVNYDEFQEGGNDSDLEGRLYAEIYYSNEIHETGENFKDNCMKTIQEIKSASNFSIQSTSKPILNNPSENSENLNNSIEKNCSLRNDETNLESLDNGEQFSSQLDQNLYVEKQVNLGTESDNIPSGVSNEIVNENLSLQEKSDRNLNSQQKGPKTQKNKSEIMNSEIGSYSPNLKNEQKQKNLSKKKKNARESPQVLNNSPNTSKSLKRTSEIEKDSGGKSKKRSIESDRSANVESNEIQLNPICLSERKSWAKTNQLPLFSDGDVDLFSEGCNENKRKKSAGKKMKEEDGKRSKATKLKDHVNVSNKQIQKLAQRTQEDEIIEISSSDSSDEAFACTETPQVKKRKQNKVIGKQMPMWLNMCSDSDESILEVPVPPKPPPLLVELKDSDSDLDSDDSSSDGIYDLKSPDSKKKQEKVTIIPNSNSTSDDSEESSVENSRGNSRGNSKENPRENSKITSIESSNVNSVESSEDNFRSRLLAEQLSLTNEASDSSYSDFPIDERVDDSTGDLVLNCTEVQKNASSLDEIKKMRNAAISSREEKEAYESVNKSSTVYNEYVESLNDASGEDDEPEFINPGPSTSKATGASTENKKKSYTKCKNAKKQKTSKEKSDEEYFFEPMSDKLKAFYNNSWGGENFSVEETQKQMSKDPRRWAILDEDWKPRLLKRQRYFLNKMKCSLCHQSGHLRANCPEPKKPPVCHMCGFQGHYETRCPHKICLTCGKKQNTYRKTCESCEKLFCTLCRSRGHKKNGCPDHWRQYHHTTSETEHEPPKNSNEVMKSSNLLICCNCTMRGHDSSTCKKYRWSEHYPTPSHVKSYNFCNQITSSNSGNCVEVLNLTESSGESSQSLNKVIELESVIEEKNSQIPENANATVSNSKSDKVKILYEFKLKIPPKLRKKSNNCNWKNKDKIVLSDVRHANLEGLIAGRISFNFLTYLCKILQCDICITLIEGSKVEMTITYYKFFSQRFVFNKFLYHWLLLSDEDKNKIMYLELGRNKKYIINEVSKKLDELDNELGNIKDLYNSVKKVTKWLKQFETKSDNVIYLKKKQELDVIMNKLVMLLYKHNCASEKEALSKLRKMFNISEKKKKRKINLNTFIWMFYYYNVIFGLYTPPNLQKMVNKYLALSRDKADTSLNNSVLSDNQDCVEQEHVDQENINQEQVDQNFHLNKPTSSISSLLEINPPSFSPQFCNDRSTLTALCSDTPQKPNRYFKNFSSPAQDFIPISNNESNHMSPKHKKQSSKQYRRNPMHNFKKFDPKVPQTNERLMQEASFLMNQALQINLPHITKAGIRMGDLINQNKLQRKHINHLKHLVNQQRRAFS